MGLACVVGFAKIATASFTHDRSADVIAYEQRCELYWISHFGKLTYHLSSDVELLSSQKQTTCSQVDGKVRRPQGKGTCIFIFFFFACPEEWVGGGVAPSLHNNWVSEIALGTSVFSAGAVQQRNTICRNKTSHEAGTVGGRARQKKAGVFGRNPVSITCLQPIVCDGPWWMAVGVGWTLGATRSQRSWCNVGKAGLLSQWI